MSESFSSGTVRARKFMGGHLVGYHWRVTVDNFCPDTTGPVEPRSHRCLVFLNEPRDWALSRVWEKITATARLRRVVVIIHERPGQNVCPGNTTCVTQQMMSHAQNRPFSLQVLSVLATLLGGMTMLIEMGGVPIPTARPRLIVTHKHVMRMDIW